jgi:CheY-like chemotaxis protein
MRHLHDAPPAPPDATASRGVKLLLATEPGDFAKSLRSRLEEHGCTVEMAVTGTDAVLMARRGYDAIFIDLETADLDGLAVLRELRSAGVSILCPVVLIKGDDEPLHIVQRGLDLGAAGFIAKRRLPAAFSVPALFESFGIVPRQALRLRHAGSDACPFSARGTFHECPAFVPINALVHAQTGLERVSCSHLRAGDVNGWRLYPRCAIGDPAARAKYVRDQTC